MTIHGQYKKQQTLTAQFQGTKTAAKGVYNLLLALNIFNTNYLPWRSHVIKPRRICCLPSLNAPFASVTFNMAQLGGASFLFAFRKPVC